MGLRQWLPLTGIVICVFIFNMSEFIPIGLLTGIAEDFGISESSAGLIISMYAWAVAILSLPLILLLRKMAFNRMLVLCVLMFSVFQVLSGLSTDYFMLMASRIGVAASHAVFWSIAAPVALKTVEPRYGKVAIGMITVGTSIALIVGLPIGRVIGLVMGWRMAFMVIAAISFMVLLLILVVLPRIENPGTFTVKRVPEIFRNKGLVCIYVVVAVYVTGCYTGYSYIEPFMLQVSKMDDLTVTVALVVFGMAGIIGSFLFSKVYDRFRFKFIVMAFSGVAIVQLMMSLCPEYVPVMFAVCIFWGICHTCYNAAIQNEVILVSPDESSHVAMSLFSGIYNVGIAMGPIVGGVVIDNTGIGNVGFFGGAIVILAIIITVFAMIPVLKKATSGKI